MLDHVHHYLIAIRQEGKAASTIEQYRWHLDKMSAWLNERAVLSPGQVDRHLLREWGAGLHDRWSPATVKQAVSVALALAPRRSIPRRARQGRSPRLGALWPSNKKTARHVDGSTFRQSRR